MNISKESSIAKVFTIYMGWIRQRTQEKETTFNHHNLLHLHHVLQVGKAQEDHPCRGVYSCLRSAQQQPRLASCLATRTELAYLSRIRKVENTNEENSIFHGTVNLELEYIHIARLSETMRSVKSLVLKKIEEVSSKAKVLRAPAPAYFKCGVPPHIH